MALFDTDSFSEGFVPRPGWITQAGQECTGAHGFYRNWIQFQSGVDIVDYSSVVVTTTDPLSNFVVAALDTRAGDAYSATPQFTMTKSDVRMDVSYIESMSSTFVTDGLQYGDLVSITGFTDDDCNGLFRVAQQDHIDAPGETGTYPGILGWPTDPDTFTGEITETRLPLQRANQVTEVLGNPVVVSLKNETSLTPPCVGGETWTISYMGSGDWSLAGSVSGIQNELYNFETVDDTGLKLTDSMYICIIPGPTAPTVGDTIVFDTIDNPNSLANSPGTQWVDPEPNNGYIVAGTNGTPAEHIATAAGASYNERNTNIRPLFIDSGGAGLDADFIFTRLTLQDHVYSPTQDYLSFTMEAFTGYEIQMEDGSQGGHPNPSHMIYMPVERDSEFYGYVSLDQRAFRPMVMQNNEWVYSYVGLIDSYRTQSEHPYPMAVVGPADFNAYGGQTWTQFVYGTGYTYGGANTSIAGTSFTEDGLWQIIEQDNTLDIRPGIAAFHPLSGWSATFYDNKIQGAFAPPRTGDAQIPIMPITCMNQIPETTADAKYTGAAENMYLGSRTSGQLRDVLCVPWNAVNEGDVLQVNGVPYLCVRGKNMEADTGIYGFRLAFKLA